VTVESNVFWDVLMFRRNVLPPRAGSTTKLGSKQTMETLRSSEMSVNFYQTTRRHVIHDNNLQNTECFLQTLLSWLRQKYGCFCKKKMNSFLGPFSSVEINTSNLL
jgi:hypothetical protein